MTKRLVEQGFIENNECLIEGYHYITIKSPKIAALTKPGQFVFIRCTSGTDPFLRRPISVCDVDLKKGIIGLLMKVIGTGTKIISDYKVGDIVDLMGPIGTAFPVFSDSRSIVIAGGIGIAPLNLLMKSLPTEKDKPTLVFGVDTQDKLFFLDDLSQLGNVIVVTEDGSAGQKGLITECLHKELDSGRYSHLYTCGPKGMLAEIQKIVSSYKIASFVSLEENLACGIGACSGCAVPIKGQKQKYTYEKVCVDGPVFKLEEVIFDEL